MTTLHRWHLSDSANPPTLSLSPSSPHEALVTARLDGPEGGCLPKTTLLWGKQHHRGTKEAHAASVAPLRSRQRELIRLSFMSTPLEVL